jgi:hypothetical protein
MVLVEILARNVCWFDLVLKIKKKSKQIFSIKKDNSCWNEPCDGCLPTDKNSLNYSCCGKKSLGILCQFSGLNFKAHA